MVTAAILLAAGDKRIDGVALSLLPWTDGDTLIECQIAALQRASVDVIEVVLGCGAERIIPLIAGNDVEPIIDDHWQAGEASWLRVGAAAVPRNTRIALLARVDQPGPAEVYRRLLEAHAASGAAITCGNADGAPAWPFAVDSAALAAIRNAPDGGSLTDIAARNAGNVTLIDPESPAIRIDTAADYAAALRVFG